MKQSRSTIALAILAALPLLLGFMYVASYFALVDEGLTICGGDSCDVGANYRFGGDDAHWFYQPIHSLDRLVRVNKWHPSYEIRYSSDFMLQADDADTNQSTLPLTPISPSTSIDAE